MKELKELRKGFHGDWVLDRNVIFTERKKALMNRDHLVKDLVQKLASYKPEDGEPPRELMEQLRRQIEQKWNVSVIPTWAAQPYIYGGFEAVRDSPDLPLSSVRTNLPHDGEITIEPLLIFNRTRGYPVSSLPKYPFEYHFPISPSDGIITIQIDLNLINKNKAPVVKNAVWKIVETHLTARERKKRFPQEPRELNFLYTCESNTFDRYLRWYDLAIDTDCRKPNGYSFRAIAFLDYVLKEHPERYEKTKTEISKRKKTIRSSRGERVLEGVIGEPMEHEDTVGHGVKVIYEAIHREPYPSTRSKTRRQKEYNCPSHGVSCPEDCSYLKSFMKDFNRRSWVFKRLITSAPAVLEQLAGEVRSQSKRKPTADQQSDTK